jgi:hypothetical protein
MMPLPMGRVSHASQRHVTVSWSFLVFPLWVFLFSASILRDSFRSLSTLHAKTEHNEV